LIGEDIVLTMVLSPDVGRVRVDPGQLELVVMNLAVNARDAMPQGGRLTIETRDVDVDQAYCRLHPDSRPGRYTELSMTDTGHGMTPEVRAHLFEPFFTTKGPGKGTGLGLATVFGIVKQSDGHIEVASEPGAGTSFKIYLPAAQGPGASAEDGDGTEPTRQGTETVLLVEDEEEVRRIVRHVLENRGYTVLEARDGVEALAVAAHTDGRIHLLVTDVVMPQMRGPELAERLRTRDPDLKVLFMSGYTDDRAILHGVIDASVSFLAKPFSPRALAQTVRAVLDGRPSG
jgi:CheY-like chemotaxis protein